MAKPKRKRNKQGKVRRLHQEPIVRRIAEILAKGKPTSFRWSSACRHAVRAALCSKGWWSWAAADERAALIVRLALVRIGAQYPTYRVAQGDPPAEPREYFYCAGCHGHMPEGSDHSWCSDTCRSTMHARVVDAQGRHEERARLRAMRAVLAPSDPAVEAPRDRSCKRCGKSFQPVNPRTRYCSMACGQRAEKYAARPCVICAEPFKPHQHVQLTCSTVCRAVYVKKSDRAAHGRPEIPSERSCEVCNSTFAPRVLASTCCSDDCRKTLYAQRAKARAAERRVELPPRSCAYCGEVFNPVQVRALVCGPACRHEVRMQQQRERMGWKRKADLAEAA